MNDNILNTKKKQEIGSFESLGLCDYVCKALKEELGDESHPFMVQTRVIPLILEGNDILVKAQTGSGKTISFIAPIIHLIIKLIKNLQIKIVDGCSPVALVISPTRELALQTYRLTQRLLKSCHLPPPILVMGGTNKHNEEEKLVKGGTILIATPGRLLDHFTHTDSINASRRKYIRFLIIDEADRLLDIGFEEELRQILKLLPHKGESRITGLFSATLDNKVEDIADLCLLQDKTRRKRIEIVNDGNVTVPTLEQGYVVCPLNLRFIFLYTFLRKNSNSKIIVFMLSCVEAKFFTELLNFINVPVLELHGRVKQNRRTSTFIQFSEAKNGVLICTDVAARGLDIPEVDWILQFDPPGSSREYIHRVGRTARAGAGGKALLLLSSYEKGFLKHLNDSEIGMAEYEFDLKPLVTSRLQSQLENLISTNHYLSQSAKLAFKTFVHSYAQRTLKSCFDIHNLDLSELAPSFGFAHPPRVSLDLALSSARLRKRERHNIETSLRSDSGLGIEGRIGKKKLKKEIQNYYGSDYNLDKKSTKKQKIQWSR